MLPLGGVDMQIFLVRIVVVHSLPFPPRTGFDGVPCNASMDTGRLILDATLGTLGDHRLLTNGTKVVPGD